MKMTCFTIYYRHITYSEYSNENGFPCCGEECIHRPSGVRRRGYRKNRLRTNRNDYAEKVLLPGQQRSSSLPNTCGRSLDPPQNSRRHEKGPQSWARRAKILRTSQKDRLPYERRPPSKNAYVVRNKLHTHARTPTVEHAWTFFSELSRSKDSICKTKRNESFTT